MAAGDVAQRVVIFLAILGSKCGENRPFRGENTWKSRDIGSEKRRGKLSCRSRSQAVHQDATQELAATARHALEDQLPIAAQGAVQHAAHAHRGLLVVPQQLVAAAVPEGVRLTEGRHVHPQQLQLRGEVAAVVSEAGRGAAQGGGQDLGLLRAGLPEAVDHATLVAGHLAHGIDVRVATAEAAVLGGSKVESEVF